MRLFEVEQQQGSLPKKAGVAAINWKGGPMREGNTIHLPNHDEVQFFPFLNGEQFLIQSRDVVFFGGTDEQPFLVQLDPQVVTSLRGGEQAFFDTIKPNGAKVLEKAFGTKTVRQGDWFAVPLPFSWEAAGGLVAMMQRDFKVEVPSTEKERKIQLRGTRHNLIALRYIALPTEEYGRRNPLNCALIGEGILKAPDHADRELKGPHAFFQTAHLVDPAKAD